eukprot:07132_5
MRKETIWCIGGCRPQAWWRGCRRQTPLKRLRPLLPSVTSARRLTRIGSWFRQGAYRRTCSSTRAPRCRLCSQQLPLASATSQPTSTLRKSSPPLAHSKSSSRCCAQRTRQQQRRRRVRCGHYASTMTRTSSALTRAPSRILAFSMPPIPSPSRSLLALSLNALSGMTTTSALFPSMEPFFPLV